MNHSFEPVHQTTESFVKCVVYSSIVVFLSLSVSALSLLSVNFILHIELCVVCFSRPYVYAVHSEQPDTYGHMLGPLSNEVKHTHFD